MGLLALGLGLLELVAPAMHPGAVLGIGSPGTISQIASGSFHNCVLYAIGEVKWYAARAHAVLFPAHTCAHTCRHCAWPAASRGARAPLAAPSSFGLGSSGQLGYDSTDDIGDDANELGTNLPFVLLPTNRTVLHLSVGGGHTCAVLSDATVRWCVARCAHGRAMGALLSRLAPRTPPRSGSRHSSSRCTRVTGRAARPRVCPRWLASPPPRLAAPFTPVGATTQTASWERVIRPMPEMARAAPWATRCPQSTWGRGPRRKVCAAELCTRA